MLFFSKQKSTTDRYLMLVLRYIVNGVHHFCIQHPGIDEPASEYIASTKSGSSEIRAPFIADRTSCPERRPTTQ